MDSHSLDQSINTLEVNNQLEADEVTKNDQYSDASTTSEFDYSCLPDFETIESMFKVKYNGLTLYGEGLPPLDDIKLSYRDAWRICKQGCQCICRKFSEPKSFNVTYFATCDGTDPVEFLVLTPSKNSSNRIVVRLFYIPSNQLKSNFVVIEGLSISFCEAMLKCL
ncbi:hypothetical protein MACJ_000925 [Theileria orientalis]|uniref:Uncharacterized protein n=1 Tax=Theileria orientalis TaxID=68886 RepID=A0A976M4V3_THEOR|nr:hypothetical protein MACJ_000925 [Theileria orientalis]